MFFRGQDGSVALGGQLQGSLFVNGALAEDAQVADFDGNGAALHGALMAGDTFTVAGETGSPVHTVTGGPHVAALNAIADVTFEPAIAAGGALDNAAVSVTANAIAQVTGWTLTLDDEELDTTCMGDDWKTLLGGVAAWRGTVQFRLDLGDARQAAMVARVLAAAPEQEAVSLTFGVHRSATPSLKQFFGAALLRNIQVTNQLGAVVSLSAEFAGSGRLHRTWQ